MKKIYFLYFISDIHFRLVSILRNNSRGKVNSSSQSFFFMVLFLIRKFYRKVLNKPMTTDCELIVMLTHNDCTVSDAYAIFETCRHTKAKFWGFKEKPLPLSEMKRLYAYMKDCGKTTFLEVIAYTESECLEGAQMALECGVDILMGTVFFDSINDFCKQHHLKYMPFVGKITGRPSILEGDIDEMIREAKSYLDKGVYGFDLLGYRYTGDASLLNKRFVAEVSAPVCLAGSIDSYERLDEVCEANPWAFTIGSAFFEHCFGDTFAEQIDKVCDYLNAKND